MIVVFSYHEKNEPDRHTPMEVPARLRFHSMYLNQETYNQRVLEPGVTYRVYEGSEAEAEDGVPKLLRLTEGFEVTHPPENKPGVAKRKKF